MMAASGKASRSAVEVMIRKLATSDVPTVLAILQESPEAAAWSQESLLQLASAGPAAWVAELTGAGCTLRRHSAGFGASATCSPPRTGIVGFLIGRIAADEFEILNMAVSPAHRRSGIGSKLLASALEFSRIAGCARAYLEVRTSNAPAIALNAGHGFTECGRRAGYYRDPVDDALLLSLYLGETR
jgi:ribosomal-protein-alanine N-acetyltransferase